MEITIQTVDDIHIAKINGTEIKNVIDYNIKTSARGSTEVTLKFVINDSVKFIAGSDNL